MKKLTIAISDKAHLELVKIQFEKRMKDGGKKTTLADIASYVIEENLAKKESA